MPGHMAAGEWQLRAEATPVPAVCLICSSVQTAEEQAAGQWAALAAGGDEVPDEKDPELLHAINEVRMHATGLQGTVMTAQE